MNVATCPCFGVGSLFGLDQLAWQVVEQLNEFLRLNRPLNKNLLLEKLDCPGAALLPYMAHARYLFLIDVMLNEKVLPGEVIYYCKDEIRQAELHHSSHGFGVQEALALAEFLGQLPGNMDVIAISLGDGKVQHEVDWNGIITALVKKIAQCAVEKCERVAVLSVTN